MTDQFESISKDELIQRAQKGLHQIDEGKEKLILMISEFYTQIQSQLASVFDRMNPYLLTQSTSNLKQYVFAHEQKKVLSGINALKEKITTFTKKSLVNIQYGQSEGVLFARKLSQIENDRLSSIDKLITLTKKYSPTISALKVVPRYYKQLFQSEHSVSRQFLVSRKSIRLAERIFKRYQEGYKGALLILGEPGSGKSALCRMIASRHFDHKNVFRVNAPAGGSINNDDFVSALSNITNINGSLENIFSSIPEKSAIIINDLEMWWERSDNGFAIINTIISLIDRYGHKTFFIINANAYTFKLINSIRNIEKSFLGVIYSDAFNTKEIEKAILTRHRSTGLKYEYNGVNESKLSEMSRAALYNDIFKFSGGSIGIALQTWLSMINSYNNEVIGLKKLPKTDFKQLSNLDNEWIVWILQFILHKQLSTERLTRIFMQDEESINSMADAMVRSGFIVTIKDNCFELNPYLQHHFIKQFKQMELL
jgi:hypothetical protein